MNLSIVTFSFREIYNSCKVTKYVSKVVIYIYLNNHLQVKVRWDFNKKSTPRPIYFNKKSTTRLLSQRAATEIFG